jgi:oxalate decarboxylase
MTPTSRRDILSLGAAAGVGAFATRASAASFGNPDEPPQGIVNTQSNPRSAVDPGPQNRTLTGQFPNDFTPPATDVGDLPLFWASFKTRRGASRTAAGPVRSPSRTSPSPNPFPA